MSPHGGPSAQSASDANALFERHRPLLFGIAYRMTGSVSDAEEIVQQAWIRRQSVADDEVEDERALLATIVTRLSIDHLKSARRRRERYVGPWLPEPLVVDDRDPADAAVQGDLLALGVMALFETLSPPQRAVVILRDAFGYPHRDIARTIELSESAVRQHYTRAKRRLAEREERFAADRERQRALLDRFARAATGGGIEELEELLAEDVTVWSDGGGKVPAARRPVTGRDDVARFIRGLVRIAPPHLEFRVADVNGEPGLLVVDDGRVDGVYAFTWNIREELQAIHAVRNPDKLAHVGLGSSATKGA